MTEEEAQCWLRDRVSPERYARLERYVGLLLSANAEQNLISNTTEATVWTRHILDSAQLRDWAPDASSWLDVGSGAGLPGLVLAIMSDAPMLLVEPRRKRAEFLQECSGALGLRHVTIRQADIERVSSPPFAAVTARAYAALPKLFTSTVRLTTSSTIWVLPKGRSAERELDEARATWQGVFHVERSLTDANARIIVATGVRALA